MEGSPRSNFALEACLSCPISQCRLVQTLLEVTGVASLRVVVLRELSNSTVQTQTIVGNKPIRTFAQVEQDLQQSPYLHGDLQVSLIQEQPVLQGSLVCPEDQQTHNFSIR